MNTVITIGTSESVSIAPRGVGVQFIYQLGFLKIVRRLDADAALLLGLGIDGVIAGYHQSYGVALAPGESIRVGTDQHGYLLTIATTIGQWQRRIKADTLRAIDLALTAALEAAHIADQRRIAASNAG